MGPHQPHHTKIIPYHTKPYQTKPKPNHGLSMHTRIRIIVHAVSLYSALLSVRFVFVVLLFLFFCCIFLLLLYGYLRLQNCKNCSEKFSRRLISFLRKRRMAKNRFKMHHFCAKWMISCQLPASIWSNISIDILYMHWCGYLSGGFVCNR